MENLVLDVYKRNPDELKKNASKRLRKSGFIPAVIYGLKTEPINIKIETKAFKDSIKGKALSGHIFDLHLKDDGKIKKMTALLKDLQKEPISREFSHIDFQRIKMGEEVNITVPVMVLNEETAIGIKEEGGVLQYGLREIEIFCLPGDIPEHIEVDVSSLRIGDVIKVSDIKISENLKVLSVADEMVVSVIRASELKEEVVTPEVVEAEPDVIKKEKIEEDKEK